MPGHYPALGSRLMNVLQHLRQPLWIRLLRVWSSLALSPGLRKVPDQIKAPARLLKPLQWITMVFSPYTFDQFPAFSRLAFHLTCYSPKSSSHRLQPPVVDGPSG